MFYLITERKLHPSKNTKENRRAEKNRLRRGPKTMRGCLPIMWRCSAAAMNLLGYQAGPCRLPLVAPSETSLEKVRSALEKYGLLGE